jgi:hypothetical protein
VGIHVAQAGELAGEFSRVGRGGLAAGAEIAAAEEIGRGDYGGAHRPVFVGALGPGQFAIDPEIEAHARSYRVPSSRSTAAVSSDVWKGFRRGSQTRKAVAKAGSGNAAR